MKNANVTEKQAEQHETGAPTLRVSDLHVEIATRKGMASVLNGVNLSIAPGEVLGLVGESGSGKSMTATSILGLLSRLAIISEGVIELNGKRIDNLTEERMRQLRGSQIGTILQDPMTALNPALRVGYQITEPLAIHKRVRGGALNREAERLLKLVGISNAAERIRTFPHQFSGGMRQRLVGAAAVSCNPSLLIADEPTTALDVTVQAEYLDLLEELQQETNSAMLFITHDLDVVQRICDRVAVMYAGRIIEEGTVEEIFARPQHPYTMGLMNCRPSMTAAKTRLSAIPGQPPNPTSLPPGCSFALRCPMAVDACRSAIPPLEYVDSTSGHRVACIRSGEWEAISEVWPEDDRPLEIKDRSQVDQSEPPTLELRDVTKVFSGSGSFIGKAKTPTIASDRVSFSVRRGQSLAIVGESGSGKTTAARIALGLESPTSGSVLFRGTPLEDLTRSQYRDYRRSVQAVFQDPSAAFNPRISVRRAVAEPLLELGGASGGRKSIGARVDECLDLVGLDPARVGDVFPHQLSGGQRQRVAIARAMSTNPDCIVLDEPMSALDVSVRVQVMNLLQELQETTGIGYLMISHDLGVVRYLSEHTIVMLRGQIVEAGETVEVYDNPTHPYTQKLLRDGLLTAAGGVQ